MFGKKVKLGLFSYVTALFFLFANISQAYIDPGTGSYIFQLLIAGLLGSLFFVKTGFRSVVSFFSKKSSAQKPVENLAAETNENE